MYDDEHEKATDEGDVFVLASDVNEITVMQFFSRI